MFVAVVLVALMRETAIGSNVPAASPVKVAVVKSCMTTTRLPVPPTNTNRVTFVKSVPSFGTTAAACLHAAYGGTKHDAKSSVAAIPIHPKKPANERPITLPHRYGKSILDLKIRRI